MRARGGRARAAAAVTLALVLGAGPAGACMVCEEGRLVLVDGEPPLAPGQAVLLLFQFGGEDVAGPGRCGGVWSVDGVEGGGPAVGTVSDCGRYVAPAVPPPDDPVVEAAEYPSGQCADCCPYARARVALAR